MTMNLDLLKKFARLANNNPNDNEANLAARRVCKMLEEFTLNFKNSLTIPGDKKVQELKVDPPGSWSGFTSPPPNNPREYKPTDSYEKGPFNPYPDFADILNAMFGGRAGGGKTKTQQQREPFVYEPTQKQKDFFDYGSSTQWNKETAPVKVCERCKKEYKSPRVINVCADCQWKEEFERRNKPPK